jgi:hypothetical protein
MIEKVSFKQEQQDIQKTQCQIQKTLAGYRALPLLEEVIELLKLFSEELSSSTQNTKELTEVEVIGRLHGFLELLTPDISIIREPLVSNDRHLRPDLLLKKNEEAVIVEVKRPGFNKRTFDLGCAQLLAYLDASKLGNGILYVPPTKGENMEIGSSLEEIGGRSIPVHYVIPKQPN